MRSPEGRRVYALCCMALLTVFRYVSCLSWFGLSSPPLPDEVIRAAMPYASWEVWQPSNIACQQPNFPLLQRARAAVALLAALLLAALSLSRGAAAAVFRRRAAGASALLVAYGLLVDPTSVAVATHWEYGLGLRQPWQAGVRQLLITSLAHAGTEGSLPPRVYGAIMLARGLLPLCARAAQVWALAGGGGGGGLAWGLASTRLLPRQPLWDVVHLALCAACVLHHQSMRARLPKEKNN